MVFLTCKSGDVHTVSQASTVLRVRAVCLRAIVRDGWAYYGGSRFPQALRLTPGGGVPAGRKGHPAGWAEAWTRKGRIFQLRNHRLGSGRRSEVAGIVQGVCRRTSAGQERDIFCCFAGVLLGQDRF
jgi:hypothetical protein